MKKLFVLLSAFVVSIFSTNTFFHIKNSHFNELLAKGGKNSIEPKFPNVPPELYYNIYLKNEMIQELTIQYLEPGMDVISTINVYYHDIITQFNISKVAKWNKIDFQQTALVLYNEIGEILDYIALYHRLIGIILLIFNASSSHTTHKLINITTQGILK